MRSIWARWLSTPASTSGTDPSQRRLGYAPVMRILLTNDDGINAPGLLALHKAISEIDPLGEVFTVAPKTVQSATSHGVTFHTPLVVEPASHVDGFAVDGRPPTVSKSRSARSGPNASVWVQGPILLSRA